MPAQKVKQETKRLRDRIEALVDQHCKSLGFRLKVLDTVLEQAGWTYFVVVPDSENVRAYEYADVLAKVEEQLRAEHEENVLIVPSLPM